MRLIDANALDEKCRRQMADEWNKRVAPVSWEEAYKEFLDDIWDAPTVDAAPVVHGRWEKRKDVFGFVRCSVCRDCNIYDDWPDGKKWNYCPNCGAKMDAV